MAWLPQIHFFPWQKRDQTDLEEGTSFSEQLPWQPEPSLPRAPAYRRDTTGYHRRAGRGWGGSATSVPSHCAHLTNKGANSASWPHDMDTCPRGIGPNIGDFHRSQPTAGRQELPGHCHLGLNWNMHTRHKGCVCNHSISPSLGICLQLQIPCSGRGVRLKVPFRGPAHPPF